MLKLLSDFSVRVVTLFGIGYLPKMPGTYGAFFGVVLFLPLSFLPIAIYCAITIFVCVLGVYLCDLAEHTIGGDDPASIVLDEVAGMLVTMLGLYQAGWMGLFIGFLLFRFFDISKLFPICWVERCFSGGLAIMLDDIVAGVFAAVLLRVLDIYLLSSFLITSYGWR